MKHKLSLTGALAALALFLSAPIREGGLAKVSGEAPGNACKKPDLRSAPPYQPISRSSTARKTRSN